MQNNFQTIESIGRPALIKKLTAKSAFNNEDVVTGVGDDTAVVEKNEDSYSLLTSETLMEGVDFDLTYMPLHHLGYKVISALMSDIYAMNGIPQTALINLAVPNKISVEMLEKVYEGIYAAGKDYEVQIAGGDLTASHQTLAVTVSGMGEVGKDAVTYRKGAKPGDAVCVSGDLGGAIAGLRILMREKQFWQESKLTEASAQESGRETFQPALDEYEYVVKRQLVPIARREIVEAFRKKSIIPSSMIDISQGLANDIRLLANASEVGIYIYQAALPVALETRNVADEMNEDADKYALYGGEDLELLFTLPEQKADEFIKEFKDVTIIGKVTEAEKGIKMQTAEGNTVQFEDAGREPSNK